MYVSKCIVLYIAEQVAAEHFTSHKTAQNPHTGNLMWSVHLCSTRCFTKKTQCALLKKDNNTAL